METRRAPCAAWTATTCLLAALAAAPAVAQTLAQTATSTPAAPSAALSAAPTARLAPATPGTALQVPSATRSAAPAARPPALAACLILPDRTAELGSPLAGIVEAVEVERGDLVKKGQVLVRLRAEVERANVGVTQTRAQSEAELRGAVAGEALAQQRLERARRLKSENFVSAQAVEQAEAEMRVAVEKVAQARELLGVSVREAGVTQAQLAQRVIRAPFDGVVTERYANPGERFEEKPLVKLAVVDTLRVELVAATAYFGRVQPGQAVEVRPDLPGAAPRTARIAQIDRVLDPASNTFRLRLALPNADLSLPAGLRCRADLGPDGADEPRLPPVALR